MSMPEACDRAAEPSRQNQPASVARVFEQKVRIDPDFAMSCRPQPRTRCAGTRAGGLHCRLGNGCAPWESAHHISRYFPSLQFPVFALLTFSSVSAFRNSLSKKTSTGPLLPRQQSNDATAFQFQRFSFSFAQLQLRFEHSRCPRSRQLPGCLIVYPSLSPCAVFRYARGYSPVRLGPVHVAHPIRSIQHFL
jgi:hypothetical protein